MITDCHAHLDLLENLDDAIRRAKEKGVVSVVSCGLEPRTNRRTLEIAENYDIVKAALGIYPVSALRQEASDMGREFDEFDVDRELEYIRKNKERIIAIGEIGLDYKQSSEKGEQKNVFLKQLKLAKELDKAVIIHSRKAEEDVLEMLEGSANVILHCFSGKLKLAKLAAEKGYFISLPTSIVRSQQYQRFVGELPLRSILTETDAPFQSPYRDRENEPAFIKDSIKKMAELRGLDPGELTNIIYLNFQRAFML